MRLAAFAVAGVLGGTMFLGAAPAFAAYTHAFSFSFGSSVLSSPQSVAVNEATGDIYVTDEGNDRVDEFDSTGNFIAAWGDDVDATTGANVCTAASGDTCQAGTSSSSPGGFEQPQFVAVDNDPSSPSFGDVYVGDSGDNLVTKFDSNGDVISSWGDQSPADGQLSGQDATAGAFGTIDGVTTDSAGNLWVYANNGDQPVYEFSQSGSFISDFPTYGGASPLISAPIGTAVDSSGDVFVGQTTYTSTTTNTSVVEYSSAGVELGVVSDDQAYAQVSGLAVDPSTGDVYVDDGGSLIRQYAGSSLASCVPAGDCAAADVFGNGTLSGSAMGLTYDTATGAVFVADPGSNQVEVFGQALVPDVTTGNASDVSVTGATLNGTVNPDGTTVTSCEFEYVPAAQYDRSAVDPYSAGQTAQCGSPFPSGSSASAVSAQLSGLTPGTVYHYRLVAGNANGSKFGADQTFATGPTIDAQAATDASDSGVTLTAEINPQGNDTTYHFEYGTSGPCSSNSCTSVPVPDQDIGSGTSDVAVSQALSGLPAGTQYDWRVVVSNSEGTVDGPDELFATNSAAATPTSAGCPNTSLMTGPSANLPDCRAYEQVTPTNKDGDEPQTVPGVAEAASTGNAVTFFSKSSFPGAVGSQTGPQLFISTRGTGGWSTSGLLPPQSLGNVGDVDGWTPDLSWSLATAGSDSLGGAGSAYLHDIATGSWTRIASYGPGAKANLVLEGVSSDGSTAVFSDDDPLTGSAPQNHRFQIYAWSASTGQLSLVSVLPDGSVVTDGPGNGARIGAQSNAVASDASAVLFTAAADAGEDNGTNQIFLREDPSAPDASTVEISASQKTNGSGSGGIDRNGPQAATFAAASPDTSEAVFTSPEELTNDANTGTADQGNDAYEYDASSGQLTDLSVPNPGVTDTDPNGAEVQGVLGMSDDGSYVYFVANGVLAAGAPVGNCRPDPASVGNFGDCDLYLWHDGTVRYITQLTAGDGHTFPGNAGAGADDTDWETGPGQTAWVTPDGQTALFESALPLTGYDNTPANPSACADNNDGPVGCSELYRYSAGSGQITCMSCDPSGAPPEGSVGLAAADEDFTGTGGVPSALAALPTRNLSSSGNQVFFQSPDELLSQDSNRLPAIYEWEADGAGSCSTAGGCLYSISTGQGAGDYLIDASASGSDVFFATWQQLVSQDQDDILDIYDARVDGGFASQNQPATAPPCVGEGCKPPPSAAPPTPPPTPVSVTFTGPGDSSSPAVAKVRVTDHAVAIGHSFRLRVTVPEAGEITASGRHLRRASRVAGRAGSYRLTLSLTKPAIRALRHGHRLRLRIRVVFTPGSGPATSASVTMTVKESKR